VAVRQAALVSDESPLEACACSRRCAIQIDDLYLLPFNLEGPEYASSGCKCLFVVANKCARNHLRSFQVIHTEPGSLELFEHCIAVRSGFQTDCSEFFCGTNLQQQINVSAVLALICSLAAGVNWRNDSRPNAVCVASQVQ